MSLLVRDVRIILFTEQPGFMRQTDRPSSFQRLLIRQTALDPGYETLKNKQTKTNWELKNLKF